MNPRLSIWYATDPSEAKYPNISTYTYCAANPVYLFDIDGADWFVNDQGFFLWSSRLSEPGFEYAGNVLPNNIDHYKILKRINGNLYHANTSNFFASVGNAIFGKGTFVEHKLYDHAQEAFNEEYIYNAAFYGACEFLGWGIKTVVGSNSIWKLTPFNRGFEYESRLLKSLNIKNNRITTKNFPVIDAFANGVATSIKTIDLTAKSYLKGNRVYRQLKIYIDELSNFHGANWGSNRVLSSEIRERVLEVGIPRGATTSQIKQLQQAAKYAESKNIQLNIRVVQ